MNTKNSRKSLLFIVLIVLIAANALFGTGCGDKDFTESSVLPSQAEQTTHLGKGEKTFSFIVVDENGKETAFKISTDEKIVGDALQELNMISGDDGEFGLYVKTVNGVTVDYDKGGKYWAFYVNGKYGNSGVDTTEIDESAVYSFKVE